MRVQEMTERLVECGLSEKESAIYLALALHGPLKASEVGKSVGISRMDAYNNLRALQQRGIVEATLEKPMRFLAMAADQALELILQERRADIERIERNKLLLAEHLRASGGDRAPVDAGFKIITDRRSIAANVRRMVAEAERDAEIVVTKRGLVRLHTLGVLEEAERASNRGVRVRLLAPVDADNLPYAQRVLAHLELRHSESVAGESVVIDGRQVLSSLSFDDAPASKGKDDIAIWTNSPDFVRAQDTFFDGAWSSAHPGEARVTEVRTGLIVEPLRINLGEGSMYEKLKEILRQRAVSARGRVIRIGAAPHAAASPYGLEQFGIDSAEIMHAVGRRIGQEIANQIRASDRASFFEELKGTWRELGLGEVSFEEGERLTITVRDSFSCQGMPELGRPLCTLDEGILSGVIEQKLKVSCVAVERSCISSGHDHCRYEVAFAGPGQFGAPAGKGGALEEEALAPRA